MTLLLVPDFEETSNLQIKLGLNDNNILISYSIYNTSL